MGLNFSSHPIFSVLRKTSDSVYYIDVLLIIDYFTIYRFERK